jgi:hypothetical protein
MPHNGRIIPESQIKKTTFFRSISDGGAENTVKRQFRRRQEIITLAVGQFPRLIPIRRRMAVKQSWDSPLLIGAE